MSQLPLAEISKVVALQDGNRFTIYVEGFTSGYGGQLKVWHRPTKELPPSFLVYSLPGNSGINPSTAPERVPTKNAASFEGSYKQIQLHTATGRIFLESVLVDNSETRSSTMGLVATDESLPELRAILNLQPGSPPHLIVSGSLMMPTPGYTLKLTKSEPQGINQMILLLHLEVVPPKGIVTQVLTPTPVTYEENVNVRYKTVQIEPENILLSVDEVF